nr:MAG TPA: hypothetical protein [Caudoviricetes sp.]
MEKRNSIHFPALFLFVVCIYRRRTQQPQKRIICVWLIPSSVNASLGWQPCAF